MVTCLHLTRTDDCQLEWYAAGSPDLDIRSRALMAAGYHVTLGSFMPTLGDDRELLTIHHLSDAPAPMAGVFVVGL